MTVNLTYKGEALLYSWSDSAAGRKVTFLLPEDGAEHPFRGYKSGPKYGQAFAIGCQPIDYDNPDPPKPGDPVKSVAGYAKPPMTESQRAGILCNTPEFQTWCSQGYPANWQAAIAEGASLPEAAACIVRYACQTSTRRALDQPGPILERWRSVLAQFEADTGRVAERTR